MHQRAGCAHSPFSYALQFSSDSRHGGQEAQVATPEGLLEREDAKCLLLDVSTCGLDQGLGGDGHFAEAGFAPGEGCESLCDCFINQCRHMNDLLAEILKLSIENRSNHCISPYFTCF